MAKHAGSALDIIKRENNTRDWLIKYLGPRQTEWFIFQGATNPPVSMNSCKHDNGEYRNLLQDLETAKRFIEQHRLEFALSRYNFNMHTTK